MTNEEYNLIIEDRVRQCIDVLKRKAGEYATPTDPLHNFKVAAELQGCKPITALAGMMCKHTVSVYDLIRAEERGDEIPMEMWEEKIGDSINYLLLLTALLHDRGGQWHERNS